MEKSLESVCLNLKGDFLIWDDSKQLLKFDGEIISKQNKNSPLKNSIYEFLNYCKTSEMSYDQKKLTEIVTKICSHESKI